MRRPTPPLARLQATTAAPHLRSAFDVAGLMRASTLALLPCALLGAHGIGRQLHLALGEAGRTQAPGWRGAAMAGLGLPLDAASVWASAVHGLLYLVPLFLAAYVAARLWERLFAAARGRALVPGAVPQALVLALLAPPTLPLWQAAIGMSFGVVLGKEVFGGTGRNLVHPAVAACAFLLLAWPASMRGGGIWVPVQGLDRPTLFELAAVQGPEVLAERGVGVLDALLGGFPGPAAASPLAALLGGAYLLARRLIAWRTVAAVCVGVLATAWLWSVAAPYATPLGGLSPAWHLLLGSLAFGAVFLATDPITSPVTHAGRWIHGLLLGGVVVLLRVANPVHPEGTVLALLLGSVFAPLNDALVITWHKLARARRG